jgi:hypothetical protein
LLLIIIYSFYVDAGRVDKSGGTFCELLQYRLGRWTGSYSRKKFPEDVFTRFRPSEFANECQYSNATRNTKQDFGYISIARSFIPFQ